jgi:hypothetical protein
MGNLVLVMGKSGFPFTKSGFRQLNWIFRSLNGVSSLQNWILRTVFRDFRSVFGRKNSFPSQKSPFFGDLVLLWSLALGI